MCSVVIIFSNDLAMKYLHIHKKYLGILFRTYHYLSARLHVGEISYQYTITIWLILRRLAFPSNTTSTNFPQLLFYAQMLVVSLILFVNFLFCVASNLYSFISAALHMCFPLRILAVSDLLPWKPAARLALIVY